MVITKILEQAANLVNKRVDFMKEIIYAKNQAPASDLPIYVLVDFGDTIFPPILLIKTCAGTNQTYYN